MSRDGATVAGISKVGAVAIDNCLSTSAAGHSTQAASAAQATT
jgi:hypothetical protein